VGYWGVFTLARTSKPTDELDSIAEVSDGAATSEQRGLWQISEFWEEDVYSAAGAVLSQLVAATDAPALVGFVLDSDCVWVDGLVPGGRRFRVCIARESTQSYLDDHDQDIDQTFLDPQAATQAAVHWSAAAGLTPTPGLLTELFTRDELDVGVGQGAWFALVEALGVGRAREDAEEANPSGT
jgi:hypothetical protein